MESSIKTKVFYIEGMTCSNCKNKIEKSLRTAAGIKKAEVSLSKNTATVSFDSSIIKERNISEIIRKAGYGVRNAKNETDRKKSAARAAGLLAIVAALYFILEGTGVLNLLVPDRLAETGVGLGMLFVIGLITSVHCIAMCGGINLSQSISGVDGGGASAVKSTALYNLGRVVSYTAVGFIAGALGSVVAFSTTTQGVLKLIAGLFMIIMGINLLGIFPALRAIMPRMPRVFTRKIGSKASTSPFAMGLLNGLMPCGPLQAVQLYAISTGSAFLGALSMFLFSIGTVPLMFGLGALGGILGKKFTRQTMTAGAVLVVVLGLTMLTQGWRLSGFTLADKGPGGDITVETQDTLPEGDIQVISSTLSRGRYPNITVEVGRPVKWIIDAPAGSINGCNNRMYIGEYKIEHTFKTGENIIEFTPQKAGTFRYSCWMGMIRGTITVIDPNA